MMVMPRWGNRHEGRFQAKNVWCFCKEGEKKITKLMALPNLDETVCRMTAAC
jgi:hypothetical protein